MNAVNELIEEAREWPSEMGEGRLINALADALESEHAEVERLHGEVERLAADVVWNIERSNTWQERAERAEAGQHEAERGGRVWRSRAEHDEFVNARLTEQLQAVTAQRFHEAYERLAPDFGYRTREASAVPWADVPEQNKRLMEATVAAILDASADEPEIDEMTLADREQDERDHAFGWPDLDGANDA